MRLRVATLNLWAIPEPIARDVDARVRAVGDELPRLSLDVAAFQEVWSRAVAERLRRAGERAGLRHGWFGDGPFGQGGLLLLSRHPIESATFEPFEVTGAPERVAANLEYLSGKGFVTVRVATPAGPLLLVNTHLHARYSRSTPHRHVPQRAAQLLQLAAHLARRPEPFVAFGDFNFRERQTDYRLMTELIGARDVAVALDRRQDTTLRDNPYRRPDSKDRRKDYVFVRDGSGLGLTPQAIERRFDERFRIDGREAAFSNHAGLVAELSLARRDAAVASAAAAGGADPLLVEETARALAHGERLARERRGDSRRLAGLGLGAAAIAAAGARSARISRRRLLRGGLGAAALFAVPPGLAFGLASEVAAPAEIAAFDRAARRLAALQPTPRSSDLAAGGVSAD